MCIFAILMSKFYSIIDIEATGGNSKIGRITEVAIYLYDGKDIVKEYNTLYWDNNNLINTLSIKQLKNINFI